MKRAVVILFALLLAGAVAEAKKPQAEAAEKAAQAKASEAAANHDAARATVQRESHIEFDDRLVQGQTAAGAIYLFQRGESEFRSMIKLPESFRDRTVRQLLPPAK